MFIQDRIDKILDTVFADKIMNHSNMQGIPNKTWKNLLLHTSNGSVRTKYNKSILSKTYDVDVTISITEKSSKDFVYTYSIGYFLQASPDDDYMNKVLLGEIPRLLPNYSFHPSPIFMFTNMAKNTTKFQKVLTSDIDELEAEINYYHQSLSNKK